MTPRITRRFGLLLSATGTVGLGAVVFLLPSLGDEEVSLFELVSSYALVALAMGALLYGLLSLAADLTVPRLLFLGIVSGALGVASIYLGSRPEILVAGSATGPLIFLFS